MDKGSFEYYSADLDEQDNIQHRTRKELAKLHTRMVDGDREAYDILWLHGTKLVLKIVNKLHNEGLLWADFNDAVAAGNLAIGEALQRWEPRKSTYATWIWIRIRGAVLDGNYKEQASGMVTPRESVPTVLSEAFSVEGDFGSMENSLFDLGEPRPGEDVQRLVEHRELVEALATLTVKQHEVIVLRYFEDLTQQETGGLLGISQQAVDTREAGALKRLKKFLEEDPC